MAITYPHTHPATPGFKRLVMKALTASALNASPLSLAHQVFLHQGESWLAEVTLPPMARATAEPWVAWELALRGHFGSFLLGDPAGATPRGSAAGNPASVDAAGQLGIALNTLAWTASQSNILLPGDYIQIAKSYATFPRAFDNAAWVKVQSSVTATNITAPNGVAEAERVTPDVAATSAAIRSGSLAPPVVAGRTFTFSIWLKAASGTPSVRIFVRNQAETGGSFSDVALTTSWSRYSVSGSMPAGSTGVIIRVGGDSTWPEADGPIDMWGAALYALDQDARLHKVLQSASSDSNGLATLDIWPRLREAPPDFSAVITSSAKGLFRLASNQSEWDIDEAKNYGMGFSAMEAF